MRQIQMEVRLNRHGPRTQQSLPLAHIRRLPHNLSLRVHLEEQMEFKLTKGW